MEVGGAGDGGGRGTAEKGLSLLVQQLLGRPLDKQEQLSNWERRPLRFSQLRYAGGHHLPPPHVTSCYMLLHVTVHHGATSYHTISRHATSGHATLCHVTFHDASHSVWFYCVM